MPPRNSKRKSEYCSLVVVVVVSSRKAVSLPCLKSFKVLRTLSLHRTVRSLQSAFAIYYVHTSYFPFVSISRMSRIVRTKFLSCFLFFLSSFSFFLFYNDMQNVNENFKSILLCFLSE